MSLSRKARSGAEHRPLWNACFLSRGAHALSFRMTSRMVAGSGNIRLPRLHRKEVRLVCGVGIGKRCVSQNSERCAYVLEAVRVTFARSSVVTDSESMTAAPE